MCGDPGTSTDKTIGSDIDAYVDSLPDDLKAEIRRGGTRTDVQLVDLNKRYQEATGLDEVSARGSLNYALLRSNKSLDDNGWLSDDKQYMPDEAKRVFRDALAKAKKKADEKVAIAAPDKTDTYLRNTGLKRATGSQFGSFLGGY
jgi:hypothetical protein